jgi:3-oxoacyl-[acyl-carrier protein] reductase
MDLGLKGKKVIITGGSRGLGRAIADQLASEGCDIGFFSRKAEQVTEQQKALAGKGVKAVGKTLDIENNEAYVGWLKDTAGALGGCDIFIHNASSSGSPPDGGNNWHKTLEVDMLGAVRGAETLQPFLEKSSSPSILLMSSTAATETFFAPTAFNAIKAAMVNYGKQLSQALAPKKIRVNCLSPGPIYFEGGNWHAVETHMKPVFDSVVAQIPFGRMGKPEEVAKAAAFLVSPAASWITGVNLVIDGGYTKRVQL